jgi:hypothetical protein
MIELKSKNGPQAFLFDNKEFYGLKKIVETKSVSDLEVLTDNGYVDIENLHKTIPYQVYELKTRSGKTIKCADNHIVFDDNMNEVFVVNLKRGDKIFILDGAVDEVEHVVDLGYKEVMYDLELSKESDRRYYTNGILSHNTHLAKQLANFMFDSEDAFIRFDMSEYMEKFNVTKLIGSPPGYVGHEDRGILTEAVKNKPYSILLFDEIEKAHPDIFNIFLQILDDGILTDATGREINFKNTIIIMTSNIGTDKIMGKKTLGFGVQTDEHESISKIVGEELKKHLRPELINRIDEKIVFNPLSEEDISKIVELEIKRTVDRISRKGYEIIIAKNVKDYLVEIGYDKEYGARPLKRAITQNVENVIAKAILNDGISEGSKIKLTFDKKTNKVTAKQ